MVDDIESTRPKHPDELEDEDKGLDDGEAA